MSPDVPDLAARVRAVGGVVALHPARPIPTSVPGRQPAEPTVRVRADHVVVAVGIAVSVEPGAHATADAVAQQLREWAALAHPGLAARVSVRVVAVEP